jgi:hypothetical protein
MLATKLQALQRGGGVEVDPYWNSVSVLLSFEGADSSSTYVNSATNGVAFTEIGNGRIRDLNPKFGTGSWYNNVTGVSGASSSLTSSVKVSTGDFTAEGWLHRLTINSNDTSGDVVFYTGRSLSNNDIWLSVGGSGNIEIRMRYNGSSWGLVTSSATGLVALNTWYAWCIERSGSTVRGYINGTPVVSGTYSGDASGGNATAYCIVGANGGVGSNRWWRGYIDEVRFTPGAARYAGASYTPRTSPFPVP